MTFIDDFSDNNKGVKYIYHLADIHIRYLDRHQEYKEVFERLINYIKNDKNRHQSIMVICGDIFHNKDRFVSETIIFFDDLLRQLTELVKVFIILGNHDVFNHKDRLDALSGIMKIKNYPNVHILKNSGLYKYSNVVFGVSSLIDKKFTSCPDDKNKLIHIGLYHGIVSGCSVETKGVNIDIFNGYDIVMLGDVHKMQYLNKNKTIAYPGSLIQQSFKEDLEHGFLLWNITTKKSSFIPLQNDYSFLDIDLHADVSQINFTKYTRTRVLLETEDLQSDLTEFLQTLSLKTKILSSKTIFKEKVLQQKNLQDNVFDTEYTLDLKEEQLIKSFVNEDDLENILKIHRNLQETIEISDMNYKNTLPWSISKIEFMNIFCYGDDHLNTIDFVQGITGILAANASGKTNILNTILYGLFGNIYTRNQNQNNRNIISRYAKKKDMYVKLTINLGEEIFYIERKAKSRKRSKASGEEQCLLTETVEFYTEDKILSLATKLETEKLIRETLSFSVKEDFVLTNMISNISYGSGISIVSMNGAQLDEIFNNMFNLNKYKLLQTEAKQKCKDLSQKMKTLTGKLEIITEQTNIDIQEIKQQVSILQEEIKTNEEVKRSKTTEIEEIYVKFQTMNKKSSSESKEFLSQRLEEIQEELKGSDINLDQEEFYEMELQRISGIIKNEEMKMALKQKRIPNLEQRDIIDIEKEISFYEGQKIKITFESDISDEYINAKKMLQQMEKTDDKLDLEEIKNYILNMKYDKKKKFYFIDETEREIILSNLNKTYFNNDELYKYKKIIQDKEERDDAINKNIIVQQKLNMLKTELKNNRINYAHDLKVLFNKYTDYLYSIDLYYELQDVKKKIASLNENKEYSELLQKKTILDSETNELNDAILSLSSKCSVLQEKISIYETNNKTKEQISSNLKDIERKYKLFKVYLDVVSSKNLPKSLISNVIKNICIEANELIFNSCGLLCEIQENEKWEIVIKKNNISVGPEHCSGYERFVINTSLKIAFDKFKQLPTIKLFLIDEVIDCVSEDNFDEIDNILNYLKRQYKNVFLISHNEELKKKVENRIMIEVKKGCSYII